MGDQLLSPESPHSNISTDSSRAIDRYLSDPVFDQAMVTEYTAFGILFLFGICINTLSLYKLTRKRMANKGSQMTLLLIHLSVADLIAILVQVLKIYIGNFKVVSKRIFVIFFISLPDLIIS